MRRNFRRLNKENGNTIINMSQISYVPSSSINSVGTAASYSDSETSVNTDPSSRGKRGAASMALSSAITGVVKKKVKLNVPTDASNNYIGKSDLKRIFLVAENIASKLLQENESSAAADDNVKKLASGVCKHCDFKDPSCLGDTYILTHSLIHSLTYLLTYSRSCCKNPPSSVYPWGIQGTDGRSLGHCQQQWKYARKEHLLNTWTHYN